MGPIQALANAVAKTFVFKGRASRAEYWWFFLVYTIVMIVCSLLDARYLITLAMAEGETALLSINFLSMNSAIAWIAMMPTLLCVAVRRLHDAGFSGFWTILYFIPLGGLVLMIMHMMPSQNTTTVHGTPASTEGVNRTGKPLTVDSHKRAMQGYALLFDKDKEVSPAQQAARKAEISDYYRSKVLKPAAGV